MNNSKTRRGTGWRIAAWLCMVVMMGCFLPLKAQNGFNMPYSQFGVGISEKPYNMPISIRRGGAVNTLSGTNFINPFNPASYAAIEQESFVFDMAVNIQLTTAIDGDIRQNDADGNIGYLAVGFPLTKWWKIGAGLMPYSTVDYETTVSGNGIKTIFDGTGGINEIFAGSAFNIVSQARQKLQVGFNVSYLTGSIQRAVTYSFTDTALYSHNSRKQKDTRINNVVFDFGLQYAQVLNEHYTLGVGLTYKPYRDMTIDEKALIYTFASGSSTEVMLDTIFPARGNDVEIESRMEQPHTFGIGVSLERDGLWQVMADATIASWYGLRCTEEMSQQVFDQSAVGDGLFSRYALGFEKKVNIDAANYWGRIGWSIGGHTDRGVMYLNMGGENQRIDQWGIGAGASLPMRKGKSLLTISVGYNSFGRDDMLRYNTLTFGVAVSSCERWFVKRKYN